MHKTHKQAASRQAQYLQRSESNGKSQDLLAHQKSVVGKSIEADGGDEVSSKVPMHRRQISLSSGIMYLQL